MLPHVYAHIFFVVSICVSMIGRGQVQAPVL